MQLVKRTGNLPVPLHIRNAPTKLMRDLGYHDGYKYPHDFPNNFIQQQYMPDTLVGERIWHSQHNTHEDRILKRMIDCWGDRYKD